MRNDRDDEFEPFHASSPTARVVAELQLYGHRPTWTSPIPVPCPISAPSKPAWPTSSTPSSQTEQDGSEIRSVELERLIAEGVSMIERRNAFEAFRDCAADLFEAHIGTAWRPRTGLRMSHCNPTAAVIDSRDFLAAKRRVEIEPLMPKGARIAVGGVDCNDHRAIWDALDRVLAKHPDMALIHGGATKGAEFIASRWADASRVTQMIFRPCRWASSSSPAPASPAIWPTRHPDSRSRFGGSEAAHERCPQSARADPNRRKR